MDAEHRGSELSAKSTVQIEWLPTVGSTNDELRTRFVADPDGLAQFATIATLSQTAGRGRLDREWIDTPQASLAMSTVVALPASIAREHIGWVPLVAGAALLATLDALEPSCTCALKWPNDVLIEGRKVAGILGDMLGVVDGGDTFVCVVGTGVNLAKSAGDLPEATSLAEHGIDIEAEQLAQRYVDELTDRIQTLLESGDAVASGLYTQLCQRLDTIGRPVRVVLADGETREGVAEGLEHDGRLRVRPDEGEPFSVYAGDVTHLRIAPSASETETPPKEGA